jgi:GNAT superfamily N-acetyltransferase
MWWRLQRSVWREGKGEGNREAMRRLVVAGAAPGILAYEGATPVGWCSLGPREDFSGLSRSRTLRPIDAEPVWSIVCFFVAKQSRRKGVTVALLREAARHARAHGARILEGYPIAPKGDSPDAFVFTGLARAYEKAGFVEVARPAPSRPIYRKKLRAGRGATAP